MACCSEQTTVDLPFRSFATIISNILSHLGTGDVTVEQLLPTQIAAFMKRFDFRKGRFRRFQVRNHSQLQTTAEMLLSIKPASHDQRIRLKLSFNYVEEFRFQRRPSTALIQLNDVRIGYFNGLFYVNLDAYPEDGPPQVIDFRASDAFLAAREIRWEIVAPKTP